MKPTVPTISLFVYLLLVSFIDSVYAEYSIPAPAAFVFLEPFGFLGLVCWWLDSDSRKRGVSWPLDIGLYLYVAWVVILPYHLIRTRGRKGLLGILLFAAAFVIAWIVLAIGFSIATFPD